MCPDGIRTVAEAADRCLSLPDGSFDAAACVCAAAEFDCSADVASAQNWTLHRRDWCCEHEAAGCDVLAEDVAEMALHIAAGTDGSAWDLLQERLSATEEEETGDAPQRHQQQESKATQGVPFFNWVVSLLLA